MKKIRILVANLLVLTSSFTLADSIRSVKVGDHYSVLASNFAEGQLVTSDDPMGKEYGFKVHRIEVEDATLFARSLPTGELYDINFAQLIPMKQADEFKATRTNGDTTITVGVSQARRSDQQGFYWAGAGINGGRHQKELIKEWKHKALLAAEEEKAKAARAASENADRVEMKF